MNSADDRTVKDGTEIGVGEGFDAEMGAWPRQCIEDSPTGATGPWWLGYTETAGTVAPVRITDDRLRQHLNDHDRILFQQLESNYSAVLYRLSLPERSTSISPESSRLRNLL